MVSKLRPALVMFQPERPQNFGAALRLCACLGAELHVVEPCGFPLHDRRIRQAALDYGSKISWQTHLDLEPFLEWHRQQDRRLILLSTRAEAAYHTAAYRPDDLIVVGRESSGAPAALHEVADRRVRVPIQAGCRSLNLVAAATIVLAEAMRQVGGFQERSDLPHRPSNAVAEGKIERS